MQKSEFFKWILGRPVRLRPSKNRLDLRVKGNVRGGDAINGESFARGIGEMEETADVVVLVVAGEDAFGLCDREAKDGESDPFAEIVGVGAVQPDEFAQGHEGSAARGFGAHGVLLCGVYFGGKKKKRTQRRDAQGAREEGVERLALQAEIGKMLGPNQIRWEERL